VTAKSRNRIVTVPLSLEAVINSCSAQTGTQCASASSLTDAGQPSPIMNLLLEPLPSSNRERIALCITDDAVFELFTELTITEYLAHHYFRVELVD